jgi:hypothetical protein
LYNDYNNPCGGIPVLLVSSTKNDYTFPTYGHGLQQAEVLLPPGLVFKFEKLLPGGIQFDSKIIRAGIFTVIKQLPFL